MDGAQVGVLEETHQVGFAGLLQSHDGRALEAQVSLEVLGDFSHQALEGQLADEELSALLVTTDFSQSHGAGPVTMGLLHTPGGWGRLPGSLGGQLLAGSLASGGFTSGLLGSSHVESEKIQIHMKRDHKRLLYIHMPGQRRLVEMHSASR